MRCARSVWAYSSTVDNGSVSEDNARKRMGWSAGFTLLNVGGVGMPGGSCREALEIADCTSCAAASMLRSRENWMVICESPCALTEDIESMPAMVVNCRSKGVATAEAMVSGLAPGRLAETWMVG